MYPQTQHETPADVNSMLVANFKSELRDWLDSAPEQLPVSQRNNKAFGGPEWFEIMYHHSILILHRHRLVSRYRESNPGDETSSVYLECADSAQCICQLYRQLYISQRMSDTWGALHLVFLAGITFLHCLWASQATRAAIRRDKVSSTCMSCMVVLVIMAERWSAVGPYRDTFDMLSNATQTMLVETETTITTPSFPAVCHSGDDQLSGYLSNIAEVGMDSLVEQLLSDMVG